MVKDVQVRQQSDSVIICQELFPRTVLTTVTFVDIISRLLGFVRRDFLITDHTDHCHLSLILGVVISEGCFIFDFASLPLEVARAI